MTWNDEARKITIKAIATVESNMKYDAINYNDPITIGVAQWYGVRAAALLNRLKNADSANWSSVASSLRSSVDTYAANNTYWNSRYLTSYEGQSLSLLLLANKPIQNQQFADDLDGYVRIAESWNYNKDTMTEAVMFFCTVYHQAPNRALAITQAVSWPPTLNAIYQQTLRDPVVGAYRNRQDTVYRIIRDKDSTGVSLPGETPGEPGEPDPGEPAPPKPSPTPSTQKRIRYLEAVGDAVHVVFSDGRRVKTYPTVTGRFLPEENAIEPDPVKPPVNLDPEPDDPDPTPTGNWSNPLDPPFNCTQAWGTTRWTDYHSGVDMGPKVPGRPGDPVYSIFDGKVTRVRGHRLNVAWNSGLGVVVELDGTHNVPGVGNVKLCYYVGHLQSQAVKEGQRVKSGQLLGRMGGSGAGPNDFAVHLHFVLFHSWRFDSSGAYLVGRSETVDGEIFLKNKGLLQGMNACPR